MAARYGAILLALATLGVAMVGLVLGGGSFGGTDGTEPAFTLDNLFNALSLGAITAVGLVIAVRRPANPIGWTFGALGFLLALFLAAGGYAICALIIAPGSLPGGEWAAWFRHWGDRSSSALLLLLFLLFPNGRLASPRWRPALVLPPVVAIGFFVGRALYQGPLPFLRIANPLGVAWVPRLADDGVFGGVPLILGGIVAAAQLAVRYRRAGGAEREQIRWLAVPVLALVVALIATVTTFLLGIPADVGVNGPVVSALFAVAEFLLPVCMGIAILRYRLYDIDVLINRALVYGATTAGIAAAFFGGIVLLQAVLRPITSGSELAVAASTLASVALFQPLRRGMQEIVDRRFYRSRYDAGRTVDEFSVRLRDQVALEAVRADLIAVVGTTLQPAHASVWLRERTR